MNQSAENAPTSQVRTRFAPSPTGYLHIGGARTALFNYLLAKHSGGKFILRIEDTDQTRNVAAAGEKMLDDLSWLGLHWDEGPQAGGTCGPYYQSQRLETYREHTRKLLDAGQAYYALETREELDAMRTAAQQRGERGFRYPRPKRFPSEAEAQRARSEGQTVVVRFKMPERDFVLKDLVLGDVQVGASELSDFVIVKGDGWPTYHFAVVIDDEQMGITHVLRGQEHLLNTANHIGLQEAFGYRTLAYAHLPIILNMNGSKMGKREKDKVVRVAAEAALKAGQIDEATIAQLSECDAQALAAWRKGKTRLPADGLRALAHKLTVTLPEIDIHDFRCSGYQPEVLINFIALLGWSPGGDREKMTLAEMCALFDIERVGKTNARFDRDKLLSFNTDALAASDPQQRLAGFRDYLSINETGPLTGLHDAVLARLLEVSPTARIFRDIEQKTVMLFEPDEHVVYDPAAVKKWLLKGDSRGMGVLRDMRAALEALDGWSAAALEELIRDYADGRELGLGKVAQPLRVAVTGSTVSPPIFDTLALLGRERTMARISRTLAKLESQADGPSE